MLQPLKSRLSIFVLFASLLLSLVFAPTSFAAQCGMNIDPYNAAGRPSPVSLAGVQWIRVEYKNCSAEPATAETLDAFKFMLNRYKSQGIKILLILDYQSYPGAAENTEQFAERAATIDKEMGQYIDAYEIWNEPDHPRHHPLSPSVFANVVNAVAPKLSKTVVLGGFASGNPQYLADALKEITVDYDAIGVHPYDQSVSGSTAGGSGSMATLMQAYKNVVPGKEMWITEIGLGSSNNTLVAQYLKSVYEANLASVIIWFDWSDQMVSPFGITSNSSKKEPIFSNFFNACGAPNPNQLSMDYPLPDPGFCGGPGDTSAENVANISADLAKEIDDFLGAGADGYIIWQYSGNKGAGEIFASDQYSFWQGTPEGDAVCAVLKQKAAQYPGKFIGANMWDLGSHNPAKIKKHLDWLNKQCGVTVVRTFAKAGGAAAVPTVLEAASGTGVKILIAIGDYSNSSDGLPAGAAGDWFREGYKGLFASIVQEVKAKSAGNPNLWGIELANEVHCRGDTTALDPYQAWGKEMAGLFTGNIGYGQKSSENTTLCDSPGVISAGKSVSDFEFANNIPEITITSAHYYTQSEKELSLQALQQAKKIGKIFYIGEANILIANGATLGPATLPVNRDEFYIHPIKGVNPTDKKLILDDLVRQGYEARCATPGFNIVLQQEGIDWMKKYLNCVNPSANFKCNSPFGRGGVFGGIPITGAPDLIGPNAQQERVVSTLTVDYRDALIPVFRDLEQQPELKRSLEDYFGYKEPSNESYSVGEIRSAPINSLLTTGQRCTQAALSLLQRDEMCNKLLKPETCALYDTKIQGTSYTVKDLLAEYIDRTAQEPDPLDNEAVCDEIIKTDSQLRTGMLNLDLHIENAYRLAFLVTTIRTRIPLSSSMMNLFQHPKRGPLNVGPDPSHVVLINAFKVPDITTNKGTIDEFGEPKSGHTDFNDPAMLTRDVLIPSTIKQKLDQQGDEERKKLLETARVVAAQAQDDGDMEIQCEIQGIGGQQCLDPFTRSVIDLVNAQGKIDDLSAELSDEELASLTATQREQLFKLDCDNKPAEEPTFIFDPAGLRPLNNDGRIFNTDFGVALLENMFTDETHMLTPDGPRDPGYADTINNKSGGWHWGLKSIFHVVPSSSLAEFQDEEKRAVKHFIVYPEGYDLKSIEAVMSGTFFSSNQIEALREKAEDYEMLKIKDDKIIFEGGRATKHVTDYTVYKNGHYCNDEYFDYHEDGTFSRKTDPCDEGDFSFQLATDRDDLRHAGILGGRLGYWMHTIQLTLQKSEALTHKYLAQCESIENFLLDACGAGVGTPGSSSPTLGTNPQSNFGNIAAEFSDLTSFQIEYWSGSTVTFQPPSQELWDAIVAASKRHGCDPWMVLATAHSESQSYTNHMTPNGVGALGVFQFTPGSWNIWTSSNAPGAQQCITHQPPTFTTEGLDFSTPTNIPAAADAACRLLTWTGAQRYYNDQTNFIRAFSKRGDNQYGQIWNAHAPQADYVWRLWHKLMETTGKEPVPAPAGYPYPVCTN